MQVSACSSEGRSPSPEPHPKRRRTYNPSEPLLNGDSNHMASAASQPVRSAASAFVASPPSRPWTMPATGSRYLNMPTPGSPRSVMSTPGSPRSFGESRQFMSLIFSRGLMFNRARNPCPPTALVLAAQRYARVPAFPKLRILDWRMRLHSWPKAARDEAGGEMNPYETALRRTLSSTW